MTPAIIYLHGFCSSPESTKAKMLKTALLGYGARTHALGATSDAPERHTPELSIPERHTPELYIPFLSPVPQKALAQIESIIEGAKRPCTLIGSSLGGYYATVLSERYQLPAALINPAVILAIPLEDYLGEHTNFHTGERFYFEPQHIEALRAMAPKRISPERYLLLLETGDELLHYQDAVSYYAGARSIIFHGGNHSFSRFPEILPKLLAFCGL